MKVFVVIGSDYDGSWVEGTYSAMSLAEVHIDRRRAVKKKRKKLDNGTSWHVEEWILDDDSIARPL